MNTRASMYKRHRFPPEIIQHAVWLYHRFNLSSRDIEDLMAERGIAIRYESIRLWCIKFGPEYAKRLRRRRAAEILSSSMRSWLRSRENSTIFGAHSTKTVRLLMYSYSLVDTERPQFAFSSDYSA